MNNLQQASLEELADAVALSVQQFRVEGLLQEADTLLDLDYSSQAAQAPFVFDMVRGTLHRNHCTAIPSSCKSALYALWELREGDAELACDICRPQWGDQPYIQTDTALDTLFGVISFLDQFSSVLQERGKEYRNSKSESPLVTLVEKLFGDFDRIRRHFPNGVHPIDIPAERDVLFAISL
jgi:hypothetical protein